MRQERIRKICRKTLAVFLASMAVLTVVSRALDSLTVPKVSVGRVKNGTVDYEAEGTGVFKPGREVFLRVPAGFTAAEILKRPGQEVRGGEALLCFRTEDLEEKKRGLELEMEKLRLELEAERAGAVSFGGVTAEELAAQALEAARRAYDAGNEELAQAELEYETRLARLEKEYGRNLDKTADEILEETGRRYRSAKRAYRSAEQARDRELKRAERQVEDCEKALEKLQASGAGEAELGEAERKLERAREDLELTREEQEDAVRDAQAGMEDAEEDYDSMKTDTGVDADALKAAYEAAVEAEKQKLQSVQKEAADREEALRMAGISLENARKNDGAEQKKLASAMEVSRLRQRRIELDLQEKDRELKEVEALLENGGAVCSPLDGILSRMEVEPGDVTEGREKLSIGLGGLRLEGEISREMGERIKEGDQFWLRCGGDNREYAATVEHVDLSAGQEKAAFTASVEEGVGRLEASASFRIQAKSEPYPTVIPIEALREDQSGFYCLLVQPRRTVLGEETAAVRFNVKVLEKSSRQAAVSGALGPESLLILSGNKPVEEGERVRVMGE